MNIPITPIKHWIDKKENSNLHVGNVYIEGIPDSEVSVDVCRAVDGLPRILVSSGETCFAKTTEHLLEDLEAIPTNGLARDYAFLGYEDLSGVLV